MKRLTIRAERLEPFDRLHDYDNNEPGATVHGVDYPALTGGTVEVFTDQASDYGLGMPCLTLAPSDQVEVWR